MEKNDSIIGSYPGPVVRELFLGIRWEFNFAELAGF